ncbi:ADP-ribosylation factor-like protein 6-interacting protein 4 isoform X2 [Narcine bancroftii]|uniref:ADP-ribosylation factor-like protein 6-interacting protein 4 isoform X2 n=1 Tax=Narcine bancroftii TaxID=1343680 RepID=UPI0038312EAA
MVVSRPRDPGPVMEVERSHSPKRRPSGADRGPGAAMGSCEGSTGAKRKRSPSAGDERRSKKRSHTSKKRKVKEMKRKSKLKRRKKKRERKEKKERSRKNPRPDVAGTPEERVQQSSNPGTVVTDEQKARIQAMRPMTKEEWEARQSVVRRVVDPETGRKRLIKGDGEVLEEIVSQERHKEINKRATKGDGFTFQVRMGLIKGDKM